MAAGDSHYISQLMRERVLGAYYLGCPLSNTFRRVFERLLDPSQTEETHPSIVKVLSSLSR